LKKENGLVWEQDGIIYMEWQIYIPNNKNLKEWILQENYDPVDIGHPGQQKMLELVKRNYWWPGIKEDIKKYMQEYIKCQQNKVQQKISIQIDCYKMKVWTDFRIRVRTEIRYR